MINQNYAQSHKMIKQSYDKLTRVDLLDFHDKSILIIGSGYIAYQYAISLSKLQVKDVTVLGNTKESLKKFKQFSNFKIISGGYENNLSQVETKDLVIIATPIPTLVKATKLAIQNRQTKILIEKPGSVFQDDLLSLKSLIKKQKVRIGYNRLFYPSFHKLKLLTENEGGITSCKFDFTEWVHTIEFGKYDDVVYRRWGISNSLHVISMAAELIGMPKKISAYQTGKLAWHPTGSIFVGSGISKNNVPFSYHANWNGGGRWGVEVVTKENIYRLSPLEKLYALTKGSTEWREIQIKSAFPETKAGITEELAVILDDSLEREVGMISLSKAIEYNNLANIIFGYNSKRNQTKTI